MRISATLAGGVKPIWAARARVASGSGTRRSDGVAQPSGRAAQGQHPVRLPAPALQGAGAGAAQRVVAGEGGGDVAVEHGRQRHRVLERLARALAEVGGHRVGGVAEQRDPTDGERRERVHQLGGLDDVDVRRVAVDQRGDAGVPVGAVVAQPPLAGPCGVVGRRGPRQVAYQ